jgi:hypothetical protein
LELCYDYNLLNSCYIGIVIAILHSIEHILLK